MNNSFSCDVQMEFLDIKIPLVGFFGSAVAVLSLGQNSLVLSLLVTRATFRNSHFIYMIFLSIFDLLLAATYLALMPVQILSEYLESPTLSGVWYSYLRPLLTLSQVSTTANAFLVIVASGERFMSFRNGQQTRIPRNTRLTRIGFAVLFAVFFKGSIFAEITVLDNPSCNNQNRYTAGLSALGNDPIYNTVWMFYIRNFATVLLPFGLLAFFNVGIFHRLRKQREIRFIQLRSTGLAFFARFLRRDNRLRTETRLIVLIISCYLLSNALNVFLTVWEYVDFQAISQHRQFYTIAADVVSLSTIIAGAIRLQIYTWSNSKIRKALPCSKEFNSETSLDLPLRQQQQLIES